MNEYTDIGQIRALLQDIHDRAVALEAEYADDLARVHPEFSEGARNLIHYLELRKSNTQALRTALRRLGLYSLAHAERNVLGSIEAVLHAIDALSGISDANPDTLARAIQTESPTAAMHRSAILGPSPEGRKVSIMVTLPTEAADNSVLVEEMLAAGMNIARINCARDDADIWARAISCRNRRRGRGPSAHIGSSSQQTGRRTMPAPNAGS